MKKCTVCLEEKPLSEFYTSFNKSEGKSYHNSYCKVCKTKKLSEWRAQNREHVNDYARKRNIKVRYGLDEAAYTELIKDGCEVCGSFDGLAVDHDHACCSGKTTCGRCVRGALCRRHNWAVANLNDSVDEALAVAKYLRKGLR